MRSSCWPVFFPPKAAPDLSPCDNFFFHLFKQKFRKLDRSTQEKKKEAMMQAYDEVTVANVRACWRKCGLLKEEVVEEEVIEVSDDDTDVQEGSDSDCYEVLGKRKREDDDVHDA